jgi:hypothetical protein
VRRRLRSADTAAFRVIRVDPGRELRAAVVSRQRLPELHEHLLGEVLGGGAVAQDAVRETEHAAPVSRDQALEGLLRPAGLDQLDDRLVGRHSGRTFSPVDTRRPACRFHGILSPAGETRGPGAAYQLA